MSSSQPGVGSQLQLFFKSVDSVENAGLVGVEPVDNSSRLLECGVNALLSSARVEARFLCPSTLIRTFHLHFLTACLECAPS